MAIIKTEKFIKGLWKAEMYPTDNRQINIFLDDDGVWYYKVQFSAHWLKDLIEVLQSAQRQYESEQDSALTHADSPE